MVYGITAKGGMMEPFKNAVLIFLLIWQMFTIHSDNITCPPQPKKPSSHSRIIYLAINHSCEISYCYYKLLLRTFTMPSHIYADGGRT